MTGNIKRFCSVAAFAALLLTPCVLSADEAPAMVWEKVQQVVKTVSMTYIVAGVATLLNILFTTIFFLRARYSFERTKMRDMLLITKLPIQISAVDELGKILYWQNEDSKVRNITPPEELKDLPFELLREIRPCIQRVFSTRKKVVHKYGIFGRYRQLEFFMLPAHVFGRRAVMWFSSDITKLHNAMDSTSQLAQSSQLILESIVDAVVVTDCDEKIVQINPAAASLLGCGEADVSGKNAGDVFHFRTDEETSQTFDPISTVLRNGLSESLPPSTIMVCGKDREYKISGNVSVMFDGTAVISGAVLCFRDITDIMNKQQQLTDMMDLAQSANRTKGRFIDAINHELRLPLNAVIGSTELLLSDSLSPADQKKYLDDINSASKTMLHLINELLNLSRIDTAEKEVQLETTDLQELVSEISWIVRGGRVDRTSQLTLETAAPLPFFRLDSGRLRQMLIYLVSCVKHWRNDAAILLHADYTPNVSGGGRLTIDIDGNASGEISAADSRSDLFFQNSVRSKVGLNNISLDFMLAQRVGQVIGGKIDVISDTEREIAIRVTLDGIAKVDAATGHTTAIKTMPEAPAVAATPGTETVPATATPGTADTTAKEKPTAESDKARSANGDYILLVDDTEMNLKVASAMLKKLNIKCVCCSSSEKAFAEIAKSIPRAILVDLWMPGMSGDEFARQLKRDPLTVGIPLAVMTADTMISPEQEALFQQTLFKPITSSMLKSCIHKLLPEADYGNN